MGDRFWQVSPVVHSGINVLLGTRSGHIACRSLRLSFCPVRALLRLPGPWGGRLGAHRSLPGCAEQRVLCPGGAKVDNQVKQTACRFLKAPQPTQLKFQERAANRKSPLSTGSDIKSGKHALARSLHSVTPARQLLFSGYTVVRFSGVVVSCGSPLC